MKKTFQVARNIGAGALLLGSCALSGAIITMCHNVSKDMRDETRVGTFGKYSVEVREKLYKDEVRERELFVYDETEGQWAHPYKCSIYAKDRSYNGVGRFDEINLGIPQGSELEQYVNLGDLEEIYGSVPKE